MKKYENYALGNWVSGNGNETVLHNAITGAEIGTVSSGLDFSSMMEYAREYRWSGSKKINISTTRFDAKKTCTSSSQSKIKVLSN